MTAANSNVLAYTPANRLASASGAWGNKAYSYDGVGNRITDVTTGGSSISRTQYYSNTSNRLNDIWENGAQLRVYGYDGAGNTLTETRPGEAFAYTYNKRNRLASVTRNGSLWGTYVYNAFEQLVSRTSPAPAAPLGTVHYIHDLDGHLIAEADGATGAVLRDYIWLPGLVHRSLGEGGNDNEVQDLPLAVIEGVNTATPVTSFIHTDHLGRPTRMTNAAKATVWQAVWTPWGEAQSMTGSITNNLRFPGQYFQIETGLNYNHHRQYDPVTGRYTQPDPLGFVDGPSVYAYAGNSPWMNVDRSGLFNEGKKRGGSTKGHSDFEGSTQNGGPFNYNSEDDDVWASPFNPFSTGNHFQELKEVEADLNFFVSLCAAPMGNRQYIIDQIGRRMHRGQDWFVHRRKGYTAPLGHFKPFQWHNISPFPYVYLPFPGYNPDLGHAADHDDEAWAAANTWTKHWLDSWRSACGCK